MNTREEIEDILIFIVFIGPPIVGTILLDRWLNLSAGMQQATDEGVYFFVLIIMGFIWYFVLEGIRLIILFVIWVRDKKFLAWLIIWVTLLVVTSCRPYFNQANTVKPDKHKKAAFN